MQDCSSTFSLDSIVVGGPRMRTLFDFVQLIADGDHNVLIEGETGTGKTTIATLIHHASRRRWRPFVGVNCAVLTQTLIESDPFEAMRSTCTDAIADRPGPFERASGGTIFLDDIDNVPRAVQDALLRLVRQRTIALADGTRQIPADVRVIAGSRRPLQQLVRDSQFHEDLFHSLNVVPIGLPPLRDRREDIPALTDHFLRRFCEARRTVAPAISPAVRDTLQHYAWPGNVAELERVCERLAQTCTCATVRVGCVPARLLFQPRDTSWPTRVEPQTPVSLDASLHDVETQLISWALRVSQGNKSRASALLRIKRSTLGDRIRKRGLDREPRAR